jgi:hypothetical protein
VHRVAACGTAVILRCSPFFTASLEGWKRAQAFVAILRDARLRSRYAGLLRMTTEYV